MPYGSCIHLYSRFFFFKEKSSQASPPLAYFFFTLRAQSACVGSYQKIRSPILDRACLAKKSQMYIINVFKIYKIRKENKFALTLHRRLLNLFLILWWKSCFLLTNCKSKTSYKKYNNFIFRLVFWNSILKKRLANKIKKEVLKTEFLKRIVYALKMS